jgi:hypothetical protein
MEQIAQLVHLCIAWRQLIQTKNRQYQQISNPADRIRPALELIELRIELSMMEDELCTHFHIPTELYASKSQNPR